MQEEIGIILGQDRYLTLREVATKIRKSEMSVSLLLRLYGGVRSF